MLAPGAIGFWKTMRSLTLATLASTENLIHSIQEIQQNYTSSRVRGAEAQALGAWLLQSPDLKLTNFTE
jgi:hypothetical protein